MNASPPDSPAPPDPSPSAETSPVSPVPPTEPPDFEALMEAAVRRQAKEASELRGCLSRIAFFLLVSAAVLHMAVLLASPEWIFEKDEPFLLECLDQIAFQAMLWGFARVLWRPSDCRPWLLLAKAGFCFQMALGTGGQSFDATLPRSAAILFMWVAMWHLLSRLGIGILGPRSESSEPPP